MEPIMKIIFLALFMPIFLFAVQIGTGKHHPKDTFLIANYYANYRADIITDISKKEIITNYDLESNTYIFKPVYYTENFLFNFSLPYSKISRGYTNETKYGLGDLTLAMGYFIPNSFGDLLLVNNLIIPTAKFDNTNRANLQLSKNRYELQEELYFFKPVVTTKIPFIIDAAVYYTHRFDDEDTKKNNGYYFGIDLTLSKIETANFMYGPAINYKRYNKEGLITQNVGSQKYQIGFNILYKLNKKDSIALEYVKDIHVSNTLKGDRTILRYVYFFSDNK